MGDERRRVRNPRGEGDRLRRQLIDAAGRLLEQGATHETLSLRGVAREVGIATTSVYLHFPDRTALLMAVYRERFAELAAFLQETIAATPEPAEQLRACCLAYERFALERPNAYRVLFEVPGVRQDPPPGVPREELPGVEAFDAIRGALERSMDAGAARRADPFLSTVCLMAALHGLVTLRINRPSFPWPATDVLVDHLLRTQVGAVLP
jgi:AcrR family transcriptional regulator